MIFQPWVESFTFIKMRFKFLWKTLQLFFLSYGFDVLSLHQYFGVFRRCSWAFCWFRRCSGVFRCSINVTYLLHIQLLRILLFLWCFNVPRMFCVTLFCVSAFLFLHYVILQVLPCLGRSLGKFTNLSGVLCMGTALLLVNVFKIKITL